MYICNFCIKRAIRTVKQKTIYTDPSEVEIMGIDGIFNNQNWFYILYGVFFAGCFLGVVLETFWCIFRYHKIESRKGLVIGPFNLVYGFGAVLMTITLYPLRETRDLWIFACGTLIGGMYEYACSVIQEKTVGTISWNYSRFSLNLHGRINLLYCFFWGLLALLWVHDVFPPLYRLIERIPLPVGIVLTWLGVLFFTLDTILTALVINRERLRRQSPEKLKNDTIGRFLDRRYPTERVVRIFPNMHFDTMKNSNLEEMKEKQLVQSIQKLNAAQRQRLRKIIAHFRDNPDENNMDEYHDED